MRTISFFCKSVVILLLAVLTINIVTAQTTRTENVYDMNPVGSLYIISGRSNLEILTWDRNEVKIVGELTYKGNDNKEDITKLLNAFKNMKDESSKDVLKLNLNPIVGMTINNKSFLKSETMTVLNNNDKISIDANNVQTVYTVWIPATLENVNLMLYSCDVNATALNNVTIDARFSKINIAKADDVSLTSHNNNSVVFGILNNIDASARFSTIRIENNMGNAKFDFYQSKLFGKNFQTLEIFARFSEFNVADISEPKINSSYQNKFNFATVHTFSCQESKFDTFKFDEIVVAASFPEAYQIKADIRGTSTSFSGFSGNFRFGTVNLKLHPNVEFNLNYNGTHGKLDVSPNKFKTRFISDQSSSKTTVQGLTAGAKCNIELVTYNTTCKIE